MKALYLEFEPCAAYFWGPVSSVVLVLETGPVSQVEGVSAVMVMVKMVMMRCHRFRCVYRFAEAWLAATGHAVIWC